MFMNKISSINKLFLTTLLLFGLYVPMGAGASSEVQENNEERNFATGINPAITTLDDGRIFVAYEKDDQLFTQVGTPTSHEVEWTDPLTFERKGDWQNPSLEVAEGMVYLTHTDKNPSSPIVYYNVGEVAIDGSVDWVVKLHWGNIVGEGKKYHLVNLKNNPTKHNMISIVSSHKGYIYGLEGWTTSTYFMYTNGIKMQNERGVNPSITSINGKSVLQINQGYGDQFLYYKFGEMTTEEGRIEWSTPFIYDHGFDPVAIQLENNHILEAHGLTGNITTYSLGTIQGDNIDFYNKDNLLALGYNHDLSLLNDGRVIDVYENGEGQLYYQLGRYVDGNMEWF
ncbi:hypothetical protein [Jeotgalibacillus marinus]|uniref:Uncharacterized protein n=1 Tax=Jeotgalibacillus marinus TaxID=86667 RepID=A0ABV3Q529_9BACL